MSLTYKTTTLQTNGVRLHTVQAGPENSPLVILLHGFPEYWYGWHHQIGLLAEAGFHVLAPDQRGYNLSDKPAPLAAYRLDVLAKDVVGLVEACGYERATLVGHDWGGVVAWWVAMRYPHRLARLAVLNAPHPWAMWRSLRRNPGQALRSLYILFFQVPRLPEALLRNNDWDVLVKGFRNLSPPGVFSDEDIEQYRQAWWRTGAMTSMLNWYRANLRMPPIFPANPRIGAPALIVWGARDPYLGVELAHQSAKLCDQGQVEVFQQATHWVQHEKVEQVNALLSNFLKT